MLLTHSAIAPPLHSAQRSTRVILVRHGRSTFNEQGRYQGSSNESVLTETGQAAALQVGILLKDLSINAIYASPLKRVEQTVNAIWNALQVERHSIPIHVTRQLREIDLLAWEGLPFKFVQEQFAEAYDCWKQRPHEFQIAAFAPTKEPPTPFFPVLDLYDRAQQFWQTVLPQHVGQTLLIVSHGGTNHALISTALGLSAAQHHTLQQSNCGVSVLEFPPDSLNQITDQVTLRSLNLTHHLGETLPKLKEGKQGLRLLLVPAVAGVESIKPLAERLKTTSIHFSLSPNFDSAQNAVHILLCHHPATVQIQTLPEDFASLWQQTLTDRRTHTPELVTGLVVALPETIQHLLVQAIGLNQEHRHLSLQPGTLSILHYPSTAQLPILQALNFGGSITGDRVKSIKSSATLPLNPC